MYWENVSFAAFWRKSKPFSMVALFMTDGWRRETTPGFAPAANCLLTG
jgi:hypothetical protein